MDSLDDRLVQLLGRNAPQSSKALAKQLGVSLAPIRRRFHCLPSQTDGTKHLLILLHHHADLLLEAVSPLIWKLVPPRHVRVKFNDHAQARQNTCYIKARESVERIALR